MIRDVRFSVRALRKNPGFMAAAVLTLALGIGANLAVFTLVNSVLLTPLPYDDPSEVVVVWPDAAFSKKDFVEGKELFETYEDMALMTRSVFSITSHGEAERLLGVRATADVFKLLGVGAALGRTFAPDEDQPGKDKVVVLSHALWRRRFAQNPEIVGRDIILDGRPHTVIGVMPEDFFFPEIDRELWVPTPLDPNEVNDYPAHYLTLIARLKDGTTLAQARPDLNRVIEIVRMTQEVPDDFGADADVESLRSYMVGDVRTALIIILGAVGFVLLLACANVANLMLARGSRRERELAVRMAIGAGRGRIVRQLLTESLFLALLGGVAGGIAAVWTIELLLAVLPDQIAVFGYSAIDFQVLLFAGLLTALSAVVFGIVPALKLSRNDLQSSLKEGTGGGFLPGRRLRLQEMLVVAQVALALVLMTGAGLLVKSFWRLQQVNPGFDAERVLMITLTPPQATYGATDVRMSYYADLLEQLSAIPGVDAVGGVVIPPLAQANFGDEIEVEGRPLPPGQQGPFVDWRAATPAYFRAMGIPLLRGRAFNDGDRMGTTRVALISESAARKVFAGEDPIGKRLSTAFDGRGNWVEIVGIVGDVKHQGLDAEARPTMYRSFNQWPWFDLTVALRTQQDPATLIAQAREAIWSIDRDVPLSDIRTMDQTVALSIARQRFYATMLLAFAAVALALGAVGLFGVLSFVVSQRTREIGLRMALGAFEKDVLGMMVRRGLALTILGTAIGIAAAFALTRVLRAFLFEVEATDPQTYIAVSLMLVAVAFLASYLPARRAARIDPMEALRYE